LLRFRVQTSYLLFYWGRRTSLLIRTELFSRFLRKLFIWKSPLNNQSGLKILDYDKLRCLPVPVRSGLLFLGR